MHPVLSKGKIRKSHLDSKGLKRSTIDSVSSKPIPSNVLESPNPELSIDTRFFKFRPIYDLVEPFEVDPYPDFSFFFLEIIGEIQAFWGLTSKRPTIDPVVLKPIPSNVLESTNPKLSVDTRFLKIRPFYDILETFEVDPYPDFSFFFQRLLVKFKLFQLCFSH